MIRKTGDRRRKTVPVPRSSLLVPRSSVPGPRSPVSCVRRLAGDTEGQAMLETAIVLPVLLLFMMAIMEICLMANAKQLANYAAFCAARTASVYGIDSTAKTHLAAALAMTSISPGNAQDAEAILSAYGMPDPSQTVRTLCGIPGFQEGDTTVWLSRLASAYVRTGEPTCDTGTAPGKTRKHVTVDITYIYRCSFLPFGDFWGHSGLNAFISYLRGLPSPIPAVIEPTVIILENAWRWNVPLHGHAVTDYWGG